MEENTPRNIKLGMVIVLVVAVALIAFTAYDRGWL